MTLRRLWILPLALAALGALLSSAIRQDAEHEYRMALIHGAIFSNVAKATKDARADVFAFDISQSPKSGTITEFEGLNVRIQHYDNVYIALLDERKHKTGPPVFDYPRLSRGEHICKPEDGCEFNFARVRLADGGGVIHRDGSIEVEGKLTQNQLIQVVMRACAQSSEEEEGRDAARVKEFEKERAEYLKLIAQLREALREQIGENMHYVRGAK